VRQGTARQRTEHRIIIAREPRQIILRQRLHRGPEHLRTTALERRTIGRRTTALEHPTTTVLERRITAQFHDRELLQPLRDQTRQITILEE
jgi:hypothetical protein